MNCGVFWKFSLGFFLLLNVSCQTRSVASRGTGPERERNLPAGPEIPPPPGDHLPASSDRPRPPPPPPPPPPEGHKGETGGKATNEETLKDKGHKNLTEWLEACLDVPGNRALTEDTPEMDEAYRQEKHLKALGETEDDRAEVFLELIKAVNKQYKKRLEKENLWLQSDEKKAWEPKKLFGPFKKDGAQYEFQPYAEKLTVEEDSQTFIFGDLHGDILTLALELKKLKEEGILDDEFKVLGEKTRLLFLGDYSDRGRYGFEVLYTLLRLRLANPEKVFLVRGNHEDWRVNEGGGFLTELVWKVGGSRVLFSRREEEKEFLLTPLKLFYDLLPVVFYLGHGEHYFQGCHGGLEFGYHPDGLLVGDKTRYELIFPFQRKVMVDHLKKEVGGFKAAFKGSMDSDSLEAWLAQKAMEVPYDDISLLGFMWNDFETYAGSLLKYQRGRGFSFGRLVTLASLEKLSSRLVGVLRAHQHGDFVVMNELFRTGGIFRFWKPGDPDWGDNETKKLPVERGDVFMFNLGVDNIAAPAGFKQSTYGELIAPRDFQDWKMKMHQVDVIK